MTGDTAMTRRAKQHYPSSQKPPLAVLHDCQRAGVDSDQLDSIVDGCDGQRVALQLRRFITQQLGDFGPEILDLPGRTREPH